MPTRDSFGSALRRERERRGVPLEAVATSTKFRLSLLEALERNDLSVLSDSYYRRTLVRAYATAIGLRPEPVVADFSRLFSHAGVPPEGETPASGLRLTIEPDSRWSTRSVSRMLSAVADTCAVLLLAGVFSQLTGTNPWVIGGAIGLAYHALATALLGRSPASWYTNRMMIGREAKPTSKRSSVRSSERASAITLN